MLDLGEIAQVRILFDVVGHYSRPEILSLTVKDSPIKTVNFKSSEEKNEVSCSSLHHEDVMHGGLRWRWAMVLEAVLDGNNDFVRENEQLLCFFLSKVMFFLSNLLFF